MSAYDEKGNYVLTVYAFIFIFLVMGIIAGGILSYRDFELGFHRQAEKQISAIAELKVNGLVNWRGERLSDARFFYQNPVFSSLVEDYFENPADASLRAEITHSMERYQSNVQYDQISLLDAEGRNRLVIPASSNDNSLAYSDLARDAAASLSSNEIIFLDFYRITDADDRIYISILVPIFAEQSGRPLGVLLLRVDPETYLYPYINQWPIPSDTSETLLVRREGEGVLFLNELRFTPDTALNLRLPLSQTETPAVQAVLGRGGVVEGMDYRGEPVLAGVRPVPDSPWFLVSKMDSAEVYGPLRERLWQTLLIVGMAIFLAGLGLITIWRQQRVLFYRAKAKAVEALRASENKFSKAFMLSPDSININRLQDGMYVSVNNGFVRITGYTPEEVIGKTSLELSIWAASQDRKKMVDGLLKNGEVENLEMRFRMKNGDIKHGLLSASVLELDGVPHIISITRDISDIKQADQKIREAQLVLESSPVVLFRWKAAEGWPVELVSENVAQFGYKPEDFLSGAVPYASIIHPDDLERVVREVREYSSSGVARFQQEYRILTKDGQVRWSDAQTVIERDAQGNVMHFQGTVTNVTERKQAEEELDRQTALFRNLFERSPEALTIVDQEDRILNVNRSFETLFGYREAEIQGQYVNDLIVSERYRDEAEDVTRMSLGDGQVVEKETVRCTKDGRLVDVSMVGYPIVVEGRIIGGSAIYRDITERKQAEKKLQIRESYLSAIIENQPGLVWLKDAEGRFLAVNQSFALSCGKQNPEQLLGKTDLDIWPVDLAQKYRGDDVEVMKSGNSRMIEEPIFDRSEMRWFETFKTPVFDQQGTIIGSTGYSRDITERKRAEEELRRQTAMFRNLFAGSPESIAVLDHEDCVLEVNRSFETLFGYLDAEARGRNINDLVASGPYLDDARDVSQTVLGKKQIVEKESIRCAKDGHPVDVSIIGYPIILEQQMFGAYAIYRDITERKKMEQSLHERERQYRTLVEQIPAIVYVDDVSNGVHTLYIGPQVEQILGYTPQEWLEKSPSIWDLQVHPDDLITVNSKFMRCAENGEPFEAEYRIRTADGRLVWVHDQAVLLRDENGNPQLIHGVMQDITERRRAEEALRAAEEKYRHIFENAMEAITQTTPQGKYITANPSAARIIGYDSPEEMIAARIDLGRQFYVKPGRRDEFKRLMEEQGSVSDFESEAYRRDGSRIWILENSRAVCDEHGNLLYYEGTAQDITERKQAVERLEQFFSINLDLLCIADLDGNFIKVNKAWEDILGYSVRELEHRKFLEFVHPDDMDSTLEAVAVLGKQEQVLNFVNRYRCLDGSYRFIEWRSQPSGNLIYAAARDITDRRQAEDEIRRNANFTNTLLDAIPTPVFYKDREGRYQGCNRAFTEVMGITSNEMQGKTVYDLWPSEYADIYHRKDVELMQNLRHQTYEFQVKDKNGAVRTVIYAKDVFRDEHGQAAGMVGAFIDITDRKQAENELRESEEKYRSVVEKSHDGILLINEHGLIIEWNQSMEALTGLSQTETIGQFAWNVLHQFSASEFKTSERLESLRNSMEQFLGTGQASWLGKTLEVTIHRPDGVSRTVLESNFPIETARGFMRGSVFRDITERKRMEDALRESEEKMRSIFRVAPVGIGAIRDQKFYEVNPRVGEITGYSVEELVGQSAQMLHVTQEEFERVIREQLEKITRQEEAVVETRWRKKDGSVIDVLLSSTLIDPDDFSKGATFTVLDITERKRAEEALKESEAIFSSFLEHSPVYVFFKDREIRSLMLSKNYEEMLGLPINELLGKTMDDLFPSDLAKNMVADDLRVLNEGRRTTVVEELNGRIYETTKFPVLKDGKPHILAGFTLDITERRQAEKALLESRALFHSLVESLPQNVYSKDLDGHFTFANQNYCATEGRTLAEILGKTDFDLHPAELAQQYHADDRHVIETGQVIEKVEVHQPLGGERSYVQVTKALIHDAEGQIKGLLGIFWDVTDRRRDEETLRVTLAKYKTLFESFPLGISVTDEAGNILETNAVAEKLLAVPQEEHIQRDIDSPKWRIIRMDGTPMPPDEFASVQALREKHIVENTQMGILKPDDSVTWLSVTATPLPLEGYGVVVTYADITARKQAEAALLESEERFRTYYENATIGLYRTTPDGRILMLNPAGVRMMGFDSFDEISKRNLEHAEFKAVRNEFREKIERDGVVIGLESKWIKKDGSTIFVRESAKAIRDGNGKTLYYDGSFEDVTERVRAEASLRESEELYRRMNQNSPLGMHFYSLYEANQLIFADANPAADKLLGVNNSQFIGKSIEEAFPSLAETEAPQRYRDAAAKGIPWSTEQISYADAQINGAFEVRAFQTTPGNMVAVFADITARKRAEEKILNLNAELEQRVRERTLQLETTNKELEAFSYSVSHDLRAPLRGIDGWSQALFEDYHEKLDEQGKQYIERVRAETQRMGRLIDDMLRLSRLTRAEMNSQQADLSALAQAIVERLQRDAPNRKVEVNIQPGMVAQGDLRLLESALVNLLENAFKFTGKRADARIEFGQIELEGRRVFFVRDNGAGFDMAYAQKLFGAFQRMHKSSEFPGTGVGLAIVQRIIHRHGGRVWAEAEIGRGAAFYFTLG